MTESLLKGKSFLIVDDEPDVLDVLEEEIREACSNCTIDRATTYETAAQLLGSKDYTLAVLDIMGVRGFDLLEIAVKRDILAVMLTAHALSPAALTESYTLGARAYLPKDKLPEIVSYLEDVLKHDFDNGWKYLREKLGNHFPASFWDYI